jgi:hypothetical protein
MAAACLWLTAMASFAVFTALGLGACVPSDECIYDEDACEIESEPKPRGPGVDPSTPLGTDCRRVATDGLRNLVNPFTCDWHDKELTFRCVFIQEPYAVTQETKYASRTDFIEEQCLGRVRRLSFSEGTRTETFTYDQQRRLEQHSAGLSSAIHEWDEKGRPTVGWSAMLGCEFPSEFIYDPEKRAVLALRSASSGLEDVCHELGGDWVDVWSYDEWGNLITASFKQGRQFTEHEFQIERYEDVCP